jgi:hypothetical protein
MLVICGNARSNRAAHVSVLPGTATLASLPMSPVISRVLLKADLANAHGQGHPAGGSVSGSWRRICPSCSASRAWRESGLGVPADIDQLQRRIIALEQQVVELAGQLEERDQGHAAARQVNRELMSNLNSTTSDSGRTRPAGR